MWFGQNRMNRSQDIEKKLTYAHELFLDNHDDEAEHLLTALASLDLTTTQHLMVLLYLGWIAYRRGKIEEALASAKLILLQDSQGYYAGKAHHLIGLCYIEQHRLYENVDDQVFQLIKQELVMAQELLQGYTDELLVIDTIAIAYANNNETEKAINIIADALQDGHPPSRELGWLYARLGELWERDRDNWEEGHIYLEKAIALLDPISKTHAWVHASLARGYNENQQYELALSHAKKALALGKLDENIQSNFLQVAHEQYAIALDRGQNNFRLAEKHYKIALDLAQEEPLKQAYIHARLGLLYNIHNRYREGLRHFRIALRLGQNSIESSRIYWGMAVASSHLKQFEDAANYFLKSAEYASEEQETLIDSYFQAGYYLYQTKKYAEAETVLRTALKSIAPDDPRKENIMKLLLTTTHSYR